jgi:hypothetical protein
VDVLLSMSPEDGVKFLRQFYAKDEGNYFLGLKPEDVPVEGPVHEEAHLCGSVGASKSNNPPAATGPSFTSKKSLTPFQTAVIKFMRMRTLFR